MRPMIKNFKQDTSDQQRHIVDVQYEPLEISSTRHVAVGSTLQIVHHPRGGSKKISTGVAVKLINNYNHANQFVSYNFDTDYGSSGSPIFMAGELVAIHHQRAPADRANRGVLMNAIRPKLLSLWSESESGGGGGCSGGGGGGGSGLKNTAVTTSASSSLNALTLSKQQQQQQQKQQQQQEEPPLDPTTTLYVNPGPNSITNGLKEAKKRHGVTVVVFKKGIHECVHTQDKFGNVVNYGVVEKPMLEIRGEGVNQTILVCGIKMMGQSGGGSSRTTSLRELTLRDSLGCGVFGDGGGLGGPSFHLENVRIEGCRGSGIEAWGMKGTGNNIEVRQCGGSGIRVYSRGSLRLSGRTTVHNNCQDERYKKETIVFEKSLFFFLFLRWTKTF